MQTVKPAKSQESLEIVMPKTSRSNMPEPLRKTSRSKDPSRVINQPWNWALGKQEEAPQDLRLQKAETSRDDEMSEASLGLPLPRQGGAEPSSIRA